MDRATQCSASVVSFSTQTPVDLADGPARSSSTTASVLPSSITSSETLRASALSHASTSLTARPSLLGAPPSSVAASPKSLLGNPPKGKRTVGIPVPLSKAFLKIHDAQMQLKPKWKILMKNQPMQNQPKKIQQRKKQMRTTPDQKHPSKTEPTVTFDLVDLPPVSPLRNSPLKPSQNLLEESLNEIDDVADCFGDPIPAEAEEAAPEHSEATPEHSEAEATAEISANRVFPWCTDTDLDNFLSPGVPMSTMSPSLN